MVRLADDSMKFLVVGLVALALTAAFVYWHGERYFSSHPVPVVNSER